jgi:hypothetical protein
MQRAIQQLRLNIQSVKELDSIYSLIVENYPLLVEQSSEILRAEIVLSVSALDCFIHDLVKYGMVETYQGNRLSSKQFETYQIPFKFLKLIDGNQQVDEKLGYLETIISEINSKDSYQSPKNIEYALGLINVNKIWSALANEMNSKADDIKNELSLIVDRRNKIAHEADYNNLSGDKYPIDRNNVNDVILFIENLCEAIYKIAQPNSP